jgi:hypothetical protein
MNIVTKSQIGLELNWLMQKCADLIQNLLELGPFLQ